MQEYYQKSTKLIIFQPGCIQYDSMLIGVSNALVSMLKSGVWNSNGIPWRKTELIPI